MVYVYRHFIPQNAAPKGAKNIGVYKGEEKICTIPLGTLTPKEGTPLYFFGLLSDIHLFDNIYVAWQPNPKFDNALTYFENQECVFCVVTGDLTQTGFYAEKTIDGVTTQVLDTAQMQVYKNICDKHTIPVYELAGNHESYYGKPIIENMALWEEYTGKSTLFYTVEQENDLLILIGQPRDSWVMRDEDLQLLYETLENNRNRRCFVFVHSYIEDDSGDPLDIPANSIFQMWGTTKTNVFISLLKHYKNTVLFHGHSHTKYQSQMYDVKANYTEINGFKSVHVSSCGIPRTINPETGTMQGDDSASQGYTVNVYADCIVLNGWNLIDNEYIPLGVFKIETPLVNIEAGTFTDRTGTIVT